MNSEMKIVVDALGDTNQFQSRREVMIKSGGLAAALALAAMPVALASMARRAYAQSALSDKIIQVLNFALTLEMLEAAFYNAGVAATGLIPDADLAVFHQIQKHENAHVAFLKGVLGSAAIGPLSFDFTAGGKFNPFGDYATFLILSQGFEDTGVRAYKGRAGDLQSNGDILTAALRIHSVEGRHASEVRRLRGEKGWITGTDPAAPAPIKPVYAGDDNVIQLGVDVSKFEGVDAGTEAFDEPFLLESDVLAIAGPFIVMGTHQPPPTEHQPSTSPEPTTHSGTTADTTTHHAMPADTTHQSAPKDTTHHAPAPTPMPTPTNTHHA